MIEFIRTSSQKIPIPANNMLNNVAGCCLSSWIYHYTISPSGGGAGDRIFSENTETTAGRARAQIGINQYHALYCGARTQDGDPSVYWDATVALALNTLYFVAVNFDFVNRLIYSYINGIYSETSPAQSWTAGNTNGANSLAAYIGSSSDGTSRFFDGKIEDIRIYNRMLSANEIKTLYCSQGRDAMWNNLVGQYTTRGKHDGFVDTGAEPVVNLFNSAYKGQPIAGMVWKSSPLNWRKN